MDLGLKGKTALVTGGNKGIGAASARRLASEGVSLLLTARNQEQLDGLAKEIRSEHGVACHTVAADLTERGSADRIVAAALDALGHVDILVSSAGAAAGGFFADLTDQDWEDALALKFHGTIRMMRAVLPHMRERKTGRIVTIAGVAGKQPGPRMLPSGAANAALLVVTTGLAQDVAADGIVVLTINPGGVKTERWNTLMTNMGKAAGTSAEEVEAGMMKEVPMGRLGEPDDIARLVTFLSSDAAGYMTGTSVTADGGQTKATA